MEFAGYIFSKYQLIVGTIFRQQKIYYYTPQFIPIPFDLHNVQLIPIEQIMNHKCVIQDTQYEMILDRGGMIQWIEV
jgi:hypothetical protein